MNKKITRKYGCALTQREDGRVLVKFNGRDHWITPDNFNALQRRGHLQETLGLNVPYVINDCGFVVARSEKVADA